MARSAAAVVPSGLPRTQEEPLGARPRLTLGDQAHINLRVGASTSVADDSGGGATLYLGLAMHV